MILFHGKINHNNFMLFVDMKKIPFLVIKLKQNIQLNFVVWIFFYKFNVELMAILIAGL